MLRIQPRIVAKYVADMLQLAVCAVIASIVAGELIARFVAQVGCTPDASSRGAAALDRSVLSAYEHGRRQPSVAALGSHRGRRPEWQLDLAPSPTRRRTSMRGACSLRCSSWLRPCPSGRATSSSTPADPAQRVSDLSRAAVRRPRLARSRPAYPTRSAVRSRSAYCTLDPRGTRDLDFNVFVEPERAREVLAALPEASR